MKSANIYDPIGSFRGKNEKIEFDIAIPVPVIKGQQNKHRKIKIEGVEKYHSTTPDIPVLFLVIKAKKKKHGSEETEDLDVDLTTLEDIHPGTLDYSKLSISFPKSDSVFVNASKILTIVFHSNHDLAKIENCFKHYISKGLYKYYLSNEKQSESFHSYYNANCNDEQGVVQPETSGGAILVGV